MCVCVCVILCIKAPCGVCFEPQPKGGPRAGCFYLLRCGLGCGLGYDQICDAGRAAGPMI